MVAHWCWSNQAWLADGSHGTGYNDYAGSGVVHVVGGTAACRWVLRLPCAVTVCCGGVLRPCAVCRAVPVCDDRVLDRVL